MKVVISGGSGFIGKYLIKHLFLDNEEHEIIILSRNKELPENHFIYLLSKEYNKEDSIKVIQWNPKELTDSLINAINNSDAIIHLAGTNIFQKRWNDSFKQELIESRIKSSEIIVSAIEKVENKPKVLVSASGISYYGDHGDDIIDENTPPSNDFLSDLAVQWENSVQKAEKFGVRTCFARIGLVLGLEGGIIQKLLPLFSWHIGGHIGNGLQWNPWIHAEDCAACIWFAVKTPELKGGFNAVSPNPVTLKELCKQFGVATNRWSWAHAPYFAVRLVLGEVAKVTQDSLRAKPTILENLGFEWKYTEILPAIENIVQSNK